MTIKLPPLPAPQSILLCGMRDAFLYYDEDEMEEYATAAVEIAEARHMEELNAYALTCSSLRAEIAGFEQGCAEDSQIGIRMRQEMIDLKADRDRLRAQLAQQGEPYGWAVSGSSSIRRGEFAEVDAKTEARRCGGAAKAFPLYTTPQPAPTVQPELTDREISDIAKSTQTAEPGRDGYILPFSFARTVLAAHEAKRGGK